ncbi:hypothetical protein CGLO_17193 [Colletotrichum gloeosporioides Cg-14]|uniref:Uncharacterized protein n=1 Tax=Colletotrichum gloeosporioides (strain Cg-14) TaxID=1237896 RepID=T0KXD1_COLGC|nr:hypothetical protein CGLO_17193 [Colletotrichum gloeosporioides Cg-14]
MSANRPNDNGDKRYPFL